MRRGRLDSGPLIPDWFGPEYPPEWDNEPDDPHDHTDQREGRDE